MSEAQHKHPRYAEAAAAYEAQRPENEDDGEPYAFIDGWLACSERFAEIYDEGVYATQDPYYHDDALDQNPYRVVAE